MGVVRDVDSRMRALVEAGIALSSELSLDAVLQRIAETAAELTGARYGALGVIDRSGTGLERFLTTGIDPETRAIIGDLPRGRGILGLLIREATPLRLHDLSEDPHSVGFPPGHPPMHTFLGVPILLRGVAYGNLYLTEKRDGADFDDEDEELATLLAAQAAVAIENARLYESATRWSRQLESLNEVGNALVTETELEPLLRLICERLRDLLDARLVSVALPVGNAGLRFTAAAGEGADELEGWTTELLDSKSGRVLQRKRSERVDSLIDDPEADQEIARRLRFRSGLFVPLVVRDRAIGVIAAHDKIGEDARFSDNDLRLAETFAARAAVAVDLSQRVARDAFRRVVSAQELERRRLARELHDETGQALTSVLLGLKSVEDAPSPEEMRAAGAELRELVVQTLQDVRRLAVELRPKALDDFGLVAGPRAADEHVRGANRDRRPFRVGHRRRASLGRGRDDALPHRPGVADERRQARPSHSGERARDTAGRSRGRRDRGRRRRLRPRPDTATAGSDCSACASGSSSSTGGSRSRHAREQERRSWSRCRCHEPRTCPHRRRPRGRPRPAFACCSRPRTTSSRSARRATPRTAVFQARALKPDVILLDVVMPDQSGLEVLPQLVHENPQAKILVLSMQDDPQYVREAFAAGASGYVLKEAADVEVVGGDPRGRRAAAATSTPSSARA